MPLLTTLIMFTIAVLLSRASVNLGFKLLDIIKAKYGAS